MGSKAIVYCAGPQYSPEESNGMLEIASLLEKNGFYTYLSRRDGLEYLILQLKNNPDVEPAQLNDFLTTMNKIAFALETFQVIRRCDSLFLNMNGRVPDEGSIFKASLAFSAGKPVTIYKNDNRSVFNGYDNSMIVGLSAGLPIVKKLNRIPEGLSKAIDNCPTSDGTFYHKDQISPFVRRAVDFGEEVWRLHNELDLSKAAAKEIYPQMLRLKTRCEQTQGMRQLQLLTPNES